MKLDRIIEAYKKHIIPDLESQEEKEIDPERKRDIEDTIDACRKDLRSKEIQKRLISQYTAQEYIGYVCFLSQAIELQIRESISQYSQLLSLLNKPIPTQGNLENESLGILIKGYRECIDNPELMSNLKNFNALRKKAIHKLFDTDYTIEEVEDEIRDNFFYEDVYEKILNPLVSHRLALSSKIAKLKHATQVPSGLQHLFEMVEKQLGVKLEEIEKNIKI